ncbi:CLUMA_CG006236, isoform A [Clunio marinus]|uniref:CLUMA_CG006236, isoform A n=1 Tax=Clunio marinus TaxID=568069 RepID=A0A1J1HXN0_9DIPT|nr:CLUMA_CG006236, isoform A [Clunio marinus]
MRLGSTSLNNPTIEVSNDYPDLDLDTPISTISASKRWIPSVISNRRGNVDMVQSQSFGSGSMTQLRDSYETEDILSYDRSRISANSISSLYGIGRTNSSSVPNDASRFFPPLDTSFTITEPSHSPHYYFNNTASENQAFFESHRSSSKKKRTTSPESIFPTKLSSAINYHHLYLNGQNSPPATSSSIQSYRSSRERSMIKRTVVMCRDQQPDGSHGFGICVKGGKETGIGIYISRVEENSVAERSGLRPGDTILEVNGTPFSGMTHDEALAILKSSHQITMTVRGPVSLHGYGPPASTSDIFKSSPMTGALLSPPSHHTCSWMDRHGRPASPPYDFEGRRSDKRDRVRNVELIIEPGQSLGLMIRGGIEYGLGIYVTGVDKDSVADHAGLNIGDQILEVNGQSFMNVTHDEAVNQFKFHKRMSLVVRDVGKVPHSCTTVESEPWDINRRKCPVSAMVEEKAHSLLPRHQFSNLSFYIKEYGARGLNVDAFVSILLEMLDTPEKHTLVTEIRELIFPEDRSRYDELVYRCGTVKSTPRVDYHSGHRSLQRLPTENIEASIEELQNQDNLSNIVPDENGNLFIRVRKTKPILGIAIEGGANTKHPLPRIINIHEHGAAFEAGGLEVGQLILEVDKNKVEGMEHQDVARLIAECYANRDCNDITFLVVEAKKSNLEPKPTALVFLEQ